MAALSEGTKRAVLDGQLFLIVVRDDGAEGEAEAELTADGSWSYLVPEGVAMVTGCRYYAHPGQFVPLRLEFAVSHWVKAGETVSGKLEIPEPEISDA